MTFRRRRHALGEAAGDRGEAALHAAQDAPMRALQTGAIVSAVRDVVDA